MTKPKGHRFSTMLGGKELVIETGKYAKQASGSIIVRYGDNMILVTAEMGNSPSRMDFLPLTVEYEERHYAAGKIPGGFLRREGRPGNQATLNARITDRQIRPLFPKHLRNEIQVIITVLSTDQSIELGPLAATGVSAAISMSDIPWDGPTACVSVGYVDGKYVINPSMQQIKDNESQLELTVAASKDAVLMVEASADELDEDVMIGAIEYAQENLAPVIELIEELQRTIGKEKREIPAPEKSEIDYTELLEKEVDSKTFKDTLMVIGKHKRSKALKAYRDDLITKLVSEEDEEAEAKTEKFKDAFRKLESKTLRTMVITEDLRSDGRNSKEVRPIWIELGVLPKAHGTAVFTRGETQVLSVATLGIGRDNRLVDDLGIETSEEFMLHYNFPPFSVGEARRLRGVSRREIGHGNLARRSLERMIPSQEEFPYVIRVVGETLESNGSSSMATVCSSSLSMMDAGVPLKKAVAGIAMGLVKEGEDYKVLTDILGSEDALGDMDFKVTGTRDGISALQMDIKIKGIDSSIMKEALLQAKVGRIHILDIMDEALDKPREEVNINAPRIIQTKIPTDKIGAVIGPGGKQIRELEALGATIEIEEDGRVRIYSEDSVAAKKVQEQIELLTATVEVGQVYKGKVAKIMDFGAFINLIPGTDGLLHISQIAEEHVKDVKEFLKEGDIIEVKVASIDGRGKVDLIRPELEGKVAPRRPSKPRDNNRGRNNRGGGGGRR